MTIINLSDHRKPPDKLEAEERYDALCAFDFRGYFENLPSHKQAEGLKSKARIIDFAYGAAIAGKYKADWESANQLAAYFQANFAKPYGRLTDIPGNARGYVWNDDARMMAFARALVSLHPGGR